MQRLYTRVLLSYNAGQMTGSLNRLGWAFVDAVRHFYENS